MLRIPLVASLAAIGLTAGSAPALNAADSFPWQRPHATVLPNGDLEWAPQPFEFVAGETIRYIDYENGNDANPGSKDKPWKHHPWDRSGNTTAPKGPVTYVFKSGVTYRGRLEGSGRGSAEDPIRLTRDPSWGEGEAVIAGSHRIAGGWKQGGEGLPDGVPDREQIWYVDLPKDVEPRTLWAVDGDDITRLNVARIPNWTYGDDATDNIKEQWFRSNRKGGEIKLPGKKRKINLLFLDDSLPKDPAFYEGANIYSEWGPVMGTAAPESVEHYDRKQHAVASHGFFPGGTKRMFGGQRYYLDDNPHYLDEGGEWWLAKSGKNQGRLYLRLPGDADPNTLSIEAGKIINLIDLAPSEHVAVSGLTFRFTNMPERGAWPWTTKPQVITIGGGGTDIRITHNRFEHVNAAVVANAAVGKVLDELVIADNEILHTDNGAVSIDRSRGDDNLPPHGQIGSVELLRNRIYRAGMWMERMSHGHCVTINAADAAHIAGNIIHRTGGWGISIRGGKGSGTGGAEPFIRYLIHHNKVVDPLVFSNDWGGIETWQGGPVYVFNNVVGNPIGYMWGGNRRFGHAYYIDGGFKNYHFNNIAWAESSTPGDHEASAAAFQEIHSYQNTWFNNTVYRFQNGSRRQKPDAGRDKFLSNVFVDIGEKVFRHSDSKNEDPNAHDAGQQGEHFAYETNAYSNNVLFDISGMVGNFHALGGDYAEIGPMAEKLAEEHTMASDIGVMAEQPPLKDPENGDFRPSGGSAVIDRGAKVFVPWSLYGVVGEWHFSQNKKDPAVIIDEHWYMTDFFTDRTTYHSTPMYPLQGTGITADHYTQSPLENWVSGALTLDGDEQYLSVAQSVIDEPFEYTAGKKQKEDRIAQGRSKPTVDIYDQHFLIETYLRTDDVDGLLLGKLGTDAGYSLELVDGKPQLTLRVAGNDATTTGDISIADGDWHHLVVEVERGDAVRMYVNGKAVSVDGGEAPKGALANGSDFRVGGGPEADGLAMTIDFLRIAHGTLEQAHTTIDELYAWQFDGPFLRDFTGAEPTGEGRDAGAIEAR